MKKTLLLAVSALLLGACSSEDRLRSGDLIFVGIPADYSIAQDSMGAAISASTGDGELNLIHVAIADVVGDSVFVIDATMAHGVDRHPLDVFLKDFTLKDDSLPVFVVKRLKKKAPGAIENAKAFCGEPYDTVFLEGNQAHYCSELVRDSFLDSKGNHLFSQQPMNWKDSSGEIPLYWRQLFGQMGMEVPQGKPGTNPQDMARSPLLKDVPVQLASLSPTAAPVKPLHALQQDFVDLRFGLFTHYGLPTYTTADWSDPAMSPEAMSAPLLDCGQWADAALSAGMTFGCISVKHHNGFCMWDSATTDYKVTNAPLGRDVLKEYCDAFAERGLKVMFHYSILDTHHKLRPNMITPEKVQMVKDQLTELLTGYGPVTAIIFDGYEAPWGRISYEDVSFQELYRLIKSLQPGCLVLDMNSDKYPREALFYTDIKFYEQGAGQKVDADENRLPSVACLPLQRTWFWKEDMPGSDNLRTAEEIVYEALVPYGKAHCSFILNAAPNRDGLIDDNALARLREIGELWARQDKTPVPLPECEAPIVERNMAKGRPAESSWSDDTCIMDLANDNDFRSAWRSVPGVPEPFWEVELDGPQPIDMIVLTEEKAGVILSYRLEYADGNRWKTLFEGEAPTPSRVKIHRFEPVTASRVRITVTASASAPAIAEFGVFRPL